MALQGQASVRSRLQQAVAETDRGAVRGVIRSQLLVRRRALPRTPVEFGFLRNSATTPPPRRTARGIVGEIGFTARYAIWVHENVDPDVEWTAPGTGPKFLERPLLESQADIRRILAEETAV